MEPDLLFVVPHLCGFRAAGWRRDCEQILVRLQSRFWREGLMPYEGGAKNLRPIKLGLRTLAL